ncbi:MAG: aminotransferase class III-fold pyridoxal phosphate-dependent enzyme [Synergistaceae bacterium]|jgi:acetylornithine/LysW-gamma-L-lysine aminotransferase|nr:aminotransferase class III-fold pyridoxal phosphate-dependent enzyme [Synergistaceae bacterium]
MPGSLSSLYGGREIAIVSGNGGLAFDSEGREYIDFFNGHGASLFGHSDPALAEALARASRGIWSSGAGFESPVRKELAAELGSILGDGRVYICNSGTEAIEAALKLAVALRPDRRRILACRRSFHGRTAGSLALTFNPKYRTPFKRILTNVEHFSADDIASAIDSDTIAVFVEPVQGEGGVYPLAPETGRAISEACARHGAILAADEIQTGLGRCGAMLASDVTGLKPDVVCLAKGLAGGLPIGAAVWRSGLGDFPSHSHGSTYGGNEITSGVALMALRLIRERNYTEHAARLGAELREGLSGVKNGAIKEVRGLGLLNGVELDVPSVDLVKRLQSGGLLSLAAGPRVVRFLPSFAATSEQVARAVEIFGRALEKGAAQ